MDKTTQKAGSLAGGIVVATLLAMVSAAAIAFVTHSRSQQYKDCIASSDVSSDQCSLLYPAQR